MSYRKAFVPIVLLVIISLILTTGMNTSMGLAKTDPTKATLPDQVQPPVDETVSPPCPEPLGVENLETAGDDSVNSNVPRPGPCTPYPTYVPPSTRTPTSTPTSITPTITPPDLTNFVRVQSGNFYVNTQPFTKHLGVNEPALLYYTGHTATTIEEELDALRNVGIKHVRVFLPDNGKTTDEIIQRLGWALDAAGARGIRLTVVFTDMFGRWTNVTGSGHRMMIPDDYDLGLYSWPNCLPETPDCIGLDWFSYKINNPNIDPYLTLVSAVVNRFKHRPEIFAWEIGNEIKVQNPQNNSMLVNFYLDTGRKIKNIDPYHMLALGIKSTADLGLTNEQAAQLYGALYTYPDQKPLFDYITIHPYVDNVGQVTWPDMQYASQFGKPIVLEEFGVHRDVVSQQGMPYVRDLYFTAYQQGIGAVLQWGVHVSKDLGVGDGKYGPREQGQLDQYKKIWSQLATQVQNWNNGICQNADIAVPSDSGWKVSIWNNRDLVGNPVERRYDALGFPFSWGNYSASFCAGNDNYSVRFERQAYFPAGRYTFRTKTDDGVRLWVDGTLIIDQWHDMSPTEYTGVKDLAAGWHAIKMEYYENGGGALAELNWWLGGTPPTPTPPPDGIYPLHITGFTGGVSQGLWITRCIGDGTQQRVWRVGTDPNWVPYSHTENVPSGKHCGTPVNGIYPVVFRTSIVTPPGAWVTQCRSNHPGEQFAFRVDTINTIDSGSYANFQRYESNSACP